MSLKVSTAILALVGGMQITGCQSLIPLIAIPVSLSGTLSQIELIAGEPSTTCGTINFTTDSGFTIGRGTFEFDADALSFVALETTPAGTGKLVAGQAIENTIVATAFVAAAALQDTATEVGDKYGPYTDVLDENFQITSVSPSSITLTQNTIDLLNGGSLSLCLQIESSVSGTFAISSFKLNLGF